MRRTMLALTVLALAVAATTIAGRAQGRRSVEIAQSNYSITRLSNYQISSLSFASPLHYALDEVAQLSG